MNYLKRIFVVTLTLLPVHCGNSGATIGGVLSGLTGTIILQNNGGDDLVINKNGAFTFSDPILFNRPYRVTVKKQPVSQTCTVAKGAGTTESSNITNVKVTCVNVSPTTASISITGSPLELLTNGASDHVTIANTSVSLTAVNIASDFTGTTLDGLVTETGNTCASLAPGQSCIITYTPGSTVVSATDFPIRGDNTNVLTASIQILQNATLASVSPTSGTSSGGTGFTLTGTGLTGTTDVTFGGISATSIHVVNSTTVTGVTPAHTVGSVDVVVTTTSGSATLNNGYTFVTTVVGSTSSGGIVACLNGGLNNLIATSADNSTSIEWSNTGTATGATSSSDAGDPTNGAQIVDFTTGATSYNFKDNTSRIRCVRAFTP